MKTKNNGYMTTFRERVSYWSYFIGQNIYYNITAAFISTYLAMQGVSLAKVATVLLIVKIWDAVNRFSDSFSTRFASNRDLRAFRGFVSRLR